MTINPILFVYFTLIAESVANKNFAHANLISKPIEITNNISKIEIGDYDTESVIYFKDQNRIVLTRTEDFNDSLSEYDYNDTLLLDKLSKHYVCFPSEVNLQSPEELVKAIKTYIIEPYYEYFGE